MSAQPRQSPAWPRRLTRLARWGVRALLGQDLVALRAAYKDLAAALTLEAEAVRAHGAVIRRQTAVYTRLAELAESADAQSVEGLDDERVVSLQAELAVLMAEETLAARRAAEAKAVSTAADSRLQSLKAAKPPTRAD